MQQSSDLAIIPVLLDYGGTRINRGDYIVYASLLGRSACVRYGLVTQLVHREPDPNSWTRPKPIRAICVHDEWEHRVRMGAPPWHLVQNGKEIALGFPDRMVVVDPERVPEMVRELLATAWKANPHVLDCQR